MSGSISWISAYTNLRDSATFILPDSSSVIPRFGDYLDTIAMEVDVFMIIGSDPKPIRIFETRKNECIPVDDNGFMIFTDQGGQTMAISCSVLPAGSEPSCFPNNGDQFEP